MQAEYNLNGTIRAAILAIVVEVCWEHILELHIPPAPSAPATLEVVVEGCCNTALDTFCGNGASSYSIFKRDGPVDCARRVCVHVCLHVRVYVRLCVSVYM